MRKIILTTGSLYSSALLLKKYLNSKSKHTFEISLETNLKPDIRWGVSGGSFKTDTEFNNPNLIQASGSKPRFSAFLTENGIPCVHFSKGNPTNYPVAVRTILNGHGGEGIVICRNEKEFLKYSGEYWTKWYTFGIELGVHILGGEIAKVFKKIPGNGIEEEYPIRNTERGYHFSLVSLEKYTKLSMYIEQFYKVFPIQFGRLDVGWDSENKLYRIIECNSAPALSSNVDTLTKYGEFLLEHVG